ncbi:GH92 family glycosyl hydrolase [Enterococcus sp. BWT-B8]|uniref:GH92 family glycosyl hydrolase n=1 Tax=Enterococcus sp. BWT-B8 TaxID=2885157 RepID=UPI001E4FEBE7|nr:GH92 family glycosyl hydrolase [Enterococcus sp. BWT-B8]MCB5951907.1 GH92 family glycosyl hydrolase [Enterococcus sp. BWT-B8]
MKISTIDTRHGTDNQYSFSHGNCLPYTGVPFGMNFFAPQTTDQKGSWWFHPDDRIFQGFRITHQPSPWMGDFSHLILLPISGELSENNLFHAQSSYRPEDSTFNPACLEITSSRYQIHSQLIPSMYGALLSLSGIQEHGGLALSLPGRYKIKKIDKTTVSGEIINFSGCEDKNFTFYFILRFEDDLTIIEGPTEGKDGFVILRFGDAAEQTIQLAASFISAEQAQLNLSREEDLSKVDFLSRAQSAWEDYLNRIEITHHDQKQVSAFYHALYRTFLFPQTFYELNEKELPVHYDTFNQTIREGVFYTNNGFWDTFRTVYPLYSLIASDKYGEMLEGFLNSYKETGFLPKWLSPDERGMMPGTLIDAVIADAAVKGIRPDLMPAFLQAMKKAATDQSNHENYGRRGTNDYLSYGYVPSTYHESVNHTLDYCYSDFCIHQVASLLEDPDAADYRKQAKNYTHLFDSETGFMRAKDVDGQFREAFDSHCWGTDYAEGSAWQNSFAVYHDFAGLIDKYGGKEHFEKKLIALCNQKPLYKTGGYGFEIHEMSEMAAIEFGQVALSNQPSFHLPYLFNYLGKPEMAQPMIKQLMSQCFSSTAQGYPGDEDNGSMSCWFIFSSLGFYPVTAGSGEYVIGIPLFDKAEIQLSSGNTLTITSTPNQIQQQFVHEVKRNNVSHPSLFFVHSDLEKGGSIDYHLGIVPNPKKYTEEQLPFSLG